VASFVCSIGNVPLAAALWSGGISFAGVIAFLFADLITFPLLLIYRRYYGTGVAVRMLIVFWAVMSAAGLATEYIFHATGLLPTTHRAVAEGPAVTMGPTTVLNVLALALLAVLWILARRRAAEGAATAVDPVCGMQVRRSDAPAQAEHDGVAVYFCSERCRDRYEQEAQVGTDAGG
jgi:YHS domain-containing protein